MYPFKLSLGLLMSLSLMSCNKKLKTELTLKSEQVEQLQGQLDHIQGTNSSLLDRLSDMSVINKAGAESIQHSLENINQQYAFIQDLTPKFTRKIRST